MHIHFLKKTKQKTTLLLSFMFITGIMLASHKSKFRKYIVFTLNQNVFPPRNERVILLTPRLSPVTKLTNKI